MLLAPRRKRPDEEGRTDMPGAGTGTLSFGGGLPNVQINDPQIPLAEALSRVPQAVATGAGAYRDAKLQGGGGGPQVSGGAQVGGQQTAPQTPAQGNNAFIATIIEALKRQRAMNPALGGQ